MKARAYRSGFTVVECLVTLAVLSILHALAMPSLSFLRDRALQLHTVDQLETAVAAARHLSVNKGTTVTLCGWSGPPGSVALQVTDFPRCGEDYAQGVSIWVLETLGWRLYRVWEWEQRTDQSLGKPLGKRACRFFGKGTRPSEYDVVNLCKRREFIVGAQPRGSA